MKFSDRTLLVCCTACNLAVFLVQALYLVPRNDTNYRLNMEQNRQLLVNQKLLSQNRDLAEQTLAATRENHRLHEQHQADLRKLAERLPLWGQKP